MSHGRSVAVENCHSGQNVGWTYGVGRNVTWSVVGGRNVKVPTPGGVSSSPIKYPYSLSGNLH
jgi:hypothetical protein